MSELKHGHRRIILQFAGTIVGIFLFALGGGSIIQTLYAMMFWLINYGDTPSQFLVSDAYNPIVFGTMQGFAIIGLGLALMLWSRSR